jgi:hypothetical protein
MATEFEAPLDENDRLTVRHITAGRVIGIERTMCGFRIPRNAQPAPQDAPECVTCRNLDA